MVFIKTTIYIKENSVESDINRISVYDRNYMRRRYVNDFGVVIMLKHVLSVFLLISLLFSCSQTRQSAEKNATPVDHKEVNQFLVNNGYSVIKYNQIKSGHSIVSAKINGISGNFILDTGAVTTSLHQDFLKKFKIKQSDSLKTLTMVGFSSITSTCIYSIESFKIHSMPINLTSVYALDLSPFIRMIQRDTGMVVHGIIGQDLLQNHNAIIDVNGSSLFIAG